VTYELVFKEDAHKEWEKLDSTIRVQFKKKLIERLENPRVESSRLNGMKDCYKIKRIYSANLFKKTLDRVLACFCKNMPKPF